MDLGSVQDCTPIASPEHQGRVWGAHSGAGSGVAGPQAPLFRLQVRT